MPERIRMPNRIRICSFTFSIATHGFHQLSSLPIGKACAKYSLHISMNMKMCVISHLQRNRIQLLVLLLGFVGFFFYFPRRNTSYLDIVTRFCCCCCCSCYWDLVFSFSLEMLESCFTVFSENKEESRYHFRKLYSNLSVVVVKLQEDGGRPLLGNCSTV